MGSLTEQIVQRKIEEKLPITYITDLEKTAVSDAILAQTSLEKANSASARNVDKADEVYKRASDLLAEVVKAKDRLDQSADVIKAISDIHSATEGIVTELASNENFRSAIAALVGTPTYPKNMIAAFNSTEGAGACPSGWKLFEPASGRFIVGAGKTKNLDMNGKALSHHPSFSEDDAKAVGGEEAHKLTIAEMPSHQHGIRRTQGKAGDGKYPDWASMGNQLVQVVGESEPAGGDQPHNTMPPFVALYYCIKD